MRPGPAAALFFIVTALAQQAQAQSLAEIAKREKERRAQLEKKKKEKEVRSFGDADLGKEGAPTANDPSDAPVTDSRATRAAKQKAAERARSTERGEAYWRSRVRQARARITAAETKLKAAEEETRKTGPPLPGQYGVKCESGRVLMPDGSLGPSVNACAAEGIEGERSRRAHKRLQEAQQELEQAREALAELREEARRAGALPGWLR